jgi:hypothetical protein
MADHWVYYILGMCFIGLAAILGTAISPAYFGIIGAGAVFLALGRSNGKPMVDPKSDKQ